MYKGKIPTGQPRTLRSIAESQIQGSEKLMPELPEQRGEYRDVAADLPSPQRGGTNAADKKPFK